MQATFSDRQPGTNGILAEKHDGQNGRLMPQIILKDTAQSRRELLALT